MLDHLCTPVSYTLGGKRLEEIDINQHLARRMKRARHVFAGGKIARCFSAVGCIHHRKKSRGNIHPLYAAHPCGSGESHEITRNSTAYGSNGILAPKPSLGKCAPDSRDCIDGLVLFARRDDEYRLLRYLGIKPCNIGIDNQILMFFGFECAKNNTPLLRENRIVDDKRRKRLHNWPRP